VKILLKKVKNSEKNFKKGKKLNFKFFWLQVLSKIDNKKTGNIVLNLTAIYFGQYLWSKFE
jgi:hypothetical protein